MRAILNGHWRVVSRLVSAAVTVASGLAFPPTASASTGCQALNQPSLDGLYYGKSITLSPLATGDTILISASYPTRPIPPATSYVPSALFLFYEDFTGLGNAEFPGTIEWVWFDDDNPAPRLKWITNPSNPNQETAEVTWSISCQDAPPPSAMGK